MRHLLLAAALGSAGAIRTPSGLFQSRRAALGLAAGAAVGVAAPASVSAADPTVKIYFGAGCFWHVQHELVGEEVAALKRSPAQISAVSGYAGGQRLGDGGRVCYHNFQQFAD